MITLEEHSQTFARCLLDQFITVQLLYFAFYQFYHSWQEGTLTQVLSKQVQELFDGQQANVLYFDVILS